MANFCPCRRICSMHPIPAIPLPIRTSFSMPAPLSSAVGEGYFHPHRALLVVGFPRDGVELALRNGVHVPLHEMEWHKNLTGRDDLGDAQLDAAHRSACGENIDALVGAKAECACIARIHLEPGAGREGIEDGDG